jgi:hypothetical protein
LKTQKKAQAKATAKVTIKTNFLLVHEPKIINGETTVLAGWLGAGDECIKAFKGNVSAYVRASLSLSVGGGDIATAPNTMAQYIRACVVAIKHEGSVNAVTNALCKEYGYADISGLRAKYKGKGQRDKKTSKPKRFDAEREAKKYTKAQLLKMLEAK